MLFEIYKNGKPNSFASDCIASMTEFLYINNKNGPTEEVILKCQTLFLSQDNRMSD